ncbi:MAG: ABC transporter permease [Pirellulaceae bacterium]|nr:ABC transporter permease [Pirellulaceae bacterium]
MRKIWVIAFREFNATVRTKAFLVGIFLMPVLMCGSVVVSIITEKLEDRSSQKIAIVDRTPGAKIAPILQTAVEKRNAQDTVNKKTGERSSPEFKLEIVPPSGSDQAAVESQRVELSKRVKDHEIIGFLEIGPDANNQRATLTAILGAIGKPKPAAPDEQADDREDPALCRFQTVPTNAGAIDFYRWSLIQVTLITRFGLTNVDEKTQKAIFDQKPPVVMLGLTTLDEKGNAIDDEGNLKTAAQLAVGLGMMMLMFMMVMVGSTPLLQSVLEEKMQKISEVLLGSVQPFQLMMGKLMGMIGVALLLSVVYVAGTLFAVNYYGFGEYIPLTLLLWFLFYLVLAVIMYGSLFSAIGAACSDMKEPQALMLPVMMPIILPMMLVGLIIKNPDGIVARAVSLFPPTTPMMMLLRQAMEANVRPWEQVVSTIGIIAFTVFCVWVGGRIFRIGILMQGKAPSFKQLVQWVVHG